jgi:hypothetical protein
MAKAATVKKLSLAQFRVWGSARAHEPFAGKLLQKPHKFRLLFGIESGKKVRLYAFSDSSCFVETVFSFRSKGKEFLAPVRVVGNLLHHLALGKVFDDLSDDVLVHVEHRGYGLLIERAVREGSKIEDVVGPDVESQFRKGRIKGARDTSCGDAQKIADPVRARRASGSSQSVAPFRADRHSTIQGRRYSDAGIIR